MVKFNGHTITAFLSGKLDQEHNGFTELFTIRGVWSDDKNVLSAGNATETFEIERALNLVDNDNGASISGNFTGRYSYGGRSFDDKCYLQFTGVAYDENLYIIEGTSEQGCYIVEGSVYTNTNVVYMTRYYYNPGLTNPKKIRNESVITTKRKRLAPVDIGRTITSATKAFRDMAMRMGKESEATDEYKFTIGKLVFNSDPEFGMTVYVKPNKDINRYYYGCITKIESNEVYIKFDNEQINGWYPLPEELNDDNFYLLATQAMMDKFAIEGVLLQGMRVMHITSRMKGTIITLESGQIEGVIGVGILYDGDKQEKTVNIGPTQSNIFFIGSRTRERDREWEDDVPVEVAAPAKFNTKEDSDVDMNSDVEEKSASTEGVGKEDEKEAAEELADLIGDKELVTTDKGTDGKTSEVGKEDDIEVGAEGSSKGPKAQKKVGNTDEKQVLVDQNCPKSLLSDGENVNKVTELVETLVEMLIKDHASDLGMDVSNKNKQLLFDETERCFHNGELGNAEVLNFYNRTVQEAKEKIDTLVLTAANDSRKELYDTVGVSMSGELVLKNDEKDETIRKLMEENARLRLQNSSVTEDEVVKGRMDQLVSEWKSKISKEKAAAEPDPETVAELEEAKKAKLEAAIAAAKPDPEKKDKLDAAIESAVSNENGKADPALFKAALDAGYSTFFILAQVEDTLKRKSSSAKPLPSTKSESEDMVMANETNEDNMSPTTISVPSPAKGGSEKGVVYYN